MTDREPVTAILEGGDQDGDEVALRTPLDLPAAIRSEEGGPFYWRLTDDHGQPMRDVFGRYRYRVQW